VEEQIPPEVHQSPTRNAEDLARLARQAPTPQQRAWYLQWADAFQRLAAISARSAKPPGGS
jgi:hypothetical protein